MLLLLFKTIPPMLAKPGRNDDNDKKKEREKISSTSIFF